jgi:hypothetical protein
MTKLNFINQQFYPVKSENIIKEQYKSAKDIYIITFFELKWRLYSLTTGKKILESKDYFLIKERVINGG